MTQGKRLAGQTRPSSSAGARSAGYRSTGAGSAGRRATGAAPKKRTFSRGTWRLTQLAISAMLLATVAAVKFTMPDVMARYGAQVRGWMEADTDFVEAFSSVGRAVGGEDLGEAVEEVCRAVFGQQAAEIAAYTPDRNAVIYGADTTPASVEMLQQVLGFPYAKPVDGTLSSSFGFRNHPVAGEEKFHYGLDLAADEGTVIRAFADGTVTVAAESSELGKYVEVTHADGYSTLYAHCKKITASAGQAVRMGDPIAEVGTTGDATGFHLHFELHQGSVYLNPIYYV